MNLQKRTEKESVSYLFSKYMSSELDLETLKLQLSAIKKEEPKPKSLSDFYDIFLLENGSHIGGYAEAHVIAHLKQFIDYFERTCIGAEHIKEKAKEEFGDRLV